MEGQEKVKTRNSFNQHRVLIRRKIPDRFVSCITDSEETGHETDRGGTRTATSEEKDTERERLQTEKRQKQKETRNQNVDVTQLIHVTGDESQENMSTT